LKRFNFEEDDDEENNNDEMFNQGFFSMGPFPIPEDGIIDQSIKICEKNFFWKFYSIDKKLKDLEKTYYFLQSMLDEQ
jgi:hypothetical protein